jgi:hypothetical protein
MNRDDFDKLRQHDLIVLDDPSRTLPFDSFRLLNFSLNMPDGQSFSDFIANKEVICRVTQDPSPAGTVMVQAIAVRLITITGDSEFTPPPRAIRNGSDGRPLQFPVTAPCIKRLLASDPPDGSSLSDSLAISNPFLFIGTLCDWHWLPSHGHGARPDLSVRARLDACDGRRILPSTMLVLLDYRRWITDRLFGQVRALAKLYSHGKRAVSAARFVSAIPGLSDALKWELITRYSAAVKQMGGNVPGSQELTSDIDINTYGDGTEFAVRWFNRLFRELFGGKESGAVFDVNIYAKDFLPQFQRPARDGDPDPWQRGEGEPARHIRPVFDHEFSTTANEVGDAQSQLMYGFAKLRRYMVDYQERFHEGRTERFHPGILEAEKSWAAFSRQVPESLQELCLRGRDFHLLWNAALCHRLRPRKEEEWPLDPEIEPLEGGRLGGCLAMEAEIDSWPDRHALMSKQNACYEYILEHEVENCRQTFEFLKFRTSADNPTGAPVPLPVHLDLVYRSLRQKMSRSLYFANEAYITAGGVLQVVGGKQLKSRKVSETYTTGTKFHNIAYTVHELMQSAVDQLADIHKEGRRHFNATPGDVGGTLISTGKYIHRFFNAIKHVYKIFCRISSTGSDAPFKHPFPARVMPTPEAWERIRRYGFGLEGLKKASLAPTAWPSADDLRPEVIRDRMTTWKAGRSGLLKFLLAEKFALSPDQVTECVTTNRGTTDRGRIAVWLAGSMEIHLVIEPKSEVFPLIDVGGNSEDRLFQFFNNILLRTLADYADYLALTDEQLRRNTLRRDRPPYFIYDPVPPRLLRKETAAVLTAVSDDDFDEDFDFDDFEE